MKAAGFVLAGGRSSRMQRNKALLPFRGGALVEHVAGIVRCATGEVTLIGDPLIYGALGIEVLPDLRPGCGPLSGIHAALSARRADWNVIVACDMPGIATEFLCRLLDWAAEGATHCVLPAGPSGSPEPLCGVWHLRCLPAVGDALDAGDHKVMEALAGLPIDIRRVSESRYFQNINTPQEWTSLAG